MHDVVIVGIPLFAVLAGILLDQADFRRLGHKIDSGFQTFGSKINARLDRVGTQLRYLHQQEIRHSARLDRLERP